MAQEDIDESHPVVPGRDSCAWSLTKLVVGHPRWESVSHFIPATLMTSMHLWFFFHLRFQRQRRSWDASATPSGRGSRSETILGVVFIMKMERSQDKCITEELNTGIVMGKPDIHPIHLELVQQCDWLWLTRSFGLNTWHLSWQTFMGCVSQFRAATIFTYLKPLKHNQYSVHKHTDWREGG